MRGIKKGDKYLCKTSNFSNFIKGNIYEVVAINIHSVAIVDALGQIYYVFFEDLQEDFTDLQEVNDIEVKDAEMVTPKYDFINPEHYKKGSKEVIDMMLDIWGVEKLIAHCEMCAFKYRMRIGNKPNQTIENDLKKAVWYENKAKELKNN